MKSVQIDESFFLQMLTKGYVTKSHVVEKGIAENDILVGADYNSFDRSITLYFDTKEIEKVDIVLRTLEDKDEI